MQNDPAIVRLARTAFDVHYAATKQPGWKSADRHWAMPGCQILWVSIVRGIADGLVKAREPLPGLGAPMPLLRGPTPAPERQDGPTPMPARKNGHAVE